MTGGIVVSSIAILISAAAFINAFTFPGGTADGVPGAGVFPQALCAVIALINLILIIQEIRNRSQEKRPETEAHKEGLKRMVLLIVATIAFIAIWRYIHFAVLCSLYIVAVGFILKQKMKFFIPGAVVSAVLVFFIFHNLLNVMLPS